MKSITIFTSILIAIGLCAIQSWAQEPESVANSPFDVSEFNAFVKEGKWDEAAGWVDDAIQKNPGSSKLLSLSLQLASRTTRAQPEASAKRMSQLIDTWCSSPSLTLESARDLQFATNMYTMQLMQKERGAEALELARRSLTTVSSMGDTARAVRRDIESNVARLLIGTEKPQEALELMRASIDSVKSGVDKGTDDLRDLVKATNVFSGLFDEVSADEVNERNKHVENLLQAKLDSPSANLADLSAYVSLRSVQLSEYTYSNPSRGIEIASELESRIKSFPEPTDAGEMKQWEGFGKSVKSMLLRLESSMVRERLIGTAAPEFTPQSFVGMEETSLASLKGKVVLLDFWAVWCGPCIATFPHLRDWHDAYADKGFVILGMTSDQGYKWDESNQKAVRGTNVSHDEELEMLASFRKHYDLRHGFVLTPKESEYNKQLAVSGIPQAVLLDKQGVIRMIKVGSGSKNAKDLEEAIEKLLDEGSKPADGVIKKEKAASGS